MFEKSGQIRANLGENGQVKKAYESYISGTNLKRLRIACFFGTVLFPAGSIFDYFIYPDQFLDFLIDRLIFTVIYIFVFFLSFTNIVKKHLSVSTIILAELMTIPIVLMVMKTGAHASAYYAGLSLIIFGMGVLFTLSMQEAFIICSVVYLTYLIPILVLDEITNLRAFLNNNYFLSFIIFIALVSNYFSLKLRFRDFESRYKLKGAIKELVRTREIERQMELYRRLASVGQLAAGVAHEINNAMNAAILGNTKLKKLLDRSKKEDLMGPFLEKSQRSMRLLNEGIRRAHGVVKNLLTFTKKNSEGFQYQRVNEGIESTVEILSNEFKNRIRVHKSYCIEDTVYCDLHQLNQVFLNILKNASDAIKEKGDIYIRTWLEDSLFCVSIKDSGLGIAGESMQKIFEPFYSTKAIGKGTGLGLSLSYNIVRSHEGDIICKSKPNEGTEFIIKLPRDFKKAVNHEPVTNRKEV